MHTQLTPDELRIFGSVGSDVRVDRTARFFFPENVRLGSHVRIDAGVIITAGSGVVVGNHVHIASACVLLGGSGEIRIGDFCGLSTHVSIFTASDDYSGGWLTNPTVPDRFRRLTSGPVALEKHAIVGAGSVIMPGCVIGEGASVGALSFVNKSVPSGLVVAGNPIRKVGVRDLQKLASLERELLDAEGPP